MDNIEKAGIYKIVNTKNNKIYIGSAHNFKLRWRVHQSHLKYNKHHSIYLQNSYNKHGVDCFKYEVVEYVEDFDKLVEREQHYINELRPEYNIANIALDGSWGKKLTEEERTSMTQARKVNQYDLDGKYIKTWGTMSLAAESLNIDVARISDCCREKVYKVEKYFWRYYEKVEVGDIIPPKRKGSPLKRKVNQYDLEGKYIKTHESISACTLSIDPDLDPDKSSPSKALCEGRVFYKGYQWKYYEGNEDCKDIPKYKRKSGKKPGIKHDGIKIQQIDKDGNVLNTFRSFTEAVEAGNGAQGLYKAIQWKEPRIYKDCYWKEV